MYKINLIGIENKYEYEELAKVFMPPEEFIMTAFESRGEYESLHGGKSTTAPDDEKTCEEPLEVIEIDAVEIASFEGVKDKALKNAVKRKLYAELSGLVGKKPEWGILTGVRPVKLAGELVRNHGEDTAREMLRSDYLLCDEKNHLIVDTYLYQQRVTGKPEDKSLGVYIGIPFCPTRCLYCSFTSNQKGYPEVLRYLEALHREIEYAGKRIKETGYHTESIYIGGGTPTTLEAKELDELLTHIEEAFDMSDVKEFTVEAGRPDTITMEKLQVLNSHKIGRISINPQSMKEETLKLIGRAHTSAQTREAMQLARKAKIPIINMDVIAGLPEETEEDFRRTLEELIDYGAENITVHTLAVKRASKLIEEDPSYHYKQAEIVRGMLETANRMLREKGYVPYYLYRQKHMAGSFENVGWCKDNTACIYNVRIMEEAQTIAALGAGGISKQYYPEENRLERVANVSNYEIYIDRLDEMIERKNINLFK